MTATQPPQLLCFPPAPTDGGRLDEHTPEKIGEWAWEPKIDDWRGVVHAPTRTVWNQYGVRSTVAEQGKIEHALDIVQRACFHMSSVEQLALEWLDIGIMENRHDMMRGCIIVFDVMDSLMTLRDRRELLIRAFPTLPPAPTLLEAGTVRGRVYLIPQWYALPHGPRLGPTPLGIQKALQDQNAAIGRKFYEGLVAKRLDSNYPMNQRAKVKTPHWIKHRMDMY